MINIPIVFTIDYKFLPPAYIAIDSLIKNADDTNMEDTDSVTILSKVDGHIVAAQYQNQIGLAFHPEMTDDTRIHRYFTDLVKLNCKNL